MNFKWETKKNRKIWKSQRRQDASHHVFSRNFRFICSQFRVLHDERNEWIEIIAVHDIIFLLLSNVMYGTKFKNDTCTLDYTCDWIDGWQSHHEKKKLQCGRTSHYRFPRQVRVSRCSQRIGIINLCILAWAGVKEKDLRDHTKLWAGEKKKDHTSHPKYEICLSKLTKDASQL